MVSEEKKTTPSKVVVKKIIHAKPERVFDAWTKPEQMEKWFGRKAGSSKINNELKIGGSYSLDMVCKPAELPASGSSEHRLHQGQYLEIRRPEKLVFTWNTPEVQDTRVTVDFRDLGDSTEVTITHELLATEELRRGHTEGWEACLENLSSYLG
jgi:uncharacterized protein YndB with AHSA1/START domain